MERNRWEIALRCLEIAIHPNTSDSEVLAAINGFRRTADRASLRELCGEFAGAGGGPSKDVVDRLIRENLELRRKVRDAETHRTITCLHLEEAEQRTREIGAELRAANHRAAVAEQQLAEFRGTYERLSGSLRHENVDMRRALDEARRNLAQPIHEPVRPFQNVLDAALQPSTPAPPSKPMPASNSAWTA